MFISLTPAASFSSPMQAFAANTVLNCPIRARVAARLDAGMNRLGGLGAALDFATGFNHLSQDARDDLLSSLCANAMDDAASSVGEMSVPSKCDGTKDPLPA
jgi:hypothetical protein